MKLRSSQNLMASLNSWDISKATGSGRGRRRNFLFLNHWRIGIYIIFRNFTKTFCFFNAFKTISSVIFYIFSSQR